MSIFDKYNQQRKDGTYQAPKENVTRQSFEATIQRDAPELYNAVHQQRVINMWNSYVDEQRRRYEEALHEATHGRMNRSYLREDMLSGSYRNQQAAETEEKRENAGKSAWESFIGMIGTGAAAQYAPANQKVDFLKQNEEYTKSFQQANKDLKATNNWAGRDALIREYNELQNKINTDERRLERGGPGDAAQLKQNKQRLEEIRRELETKDEAAGNVPQSYSTADRLDSVVGGAVKNIGGSLTSAAVTAADAISRARENRKIMSDFLKNPETPVDPQQFRDVQSAAYRSEESQQKWDSVYQMAQTLSDDAAAELERAKGGLGFIGQAGVDIGENIIEMGFDAAVGALTGGSALVPMFARVFGQGAQEARNAGATLDQQIGYGLTSAMIEVATEKMFDGVARIYGAGAADEITERVIGRLAQSDTGRSFLRLIASGVGEGAEEVVSDLLSPLAEAIYKDQSVGELYRELNPADTIYSFLIGAAIGTLGGGVSFINGQNAAKNAELRDIDAQRAEQRAMRQAGYGTVSNQVDAAWDVLTGRVTPEQQQTRTVQAQETIGLTPEQARTVEQYQNAPQEVRQQAAASANTAALLTSTFTASGIELNETEQETLTRLAQDGDAGTKDTVLGMRDAYRLGQQGKTLEETTLAVEERGLTPTQISRAWGFGASVQTAESGTADVSTEEGKTRLQAALAALGQHTEAAAKAYEARQDVGRYAAAMQKAAYLYAANGADLAKIVQDARDGKTADIVGYLTDEQVKLAQQIGQEQRQQVREAERAMSESRAALRQQAAAITAGQTVTAQALAETDTAIDVANRASQRAVNAINQTVERLEAMVKANPNAENTEAYRQAYDEAMQNKKKVEDLQKTVRELRRRKAEMEGKKTIKRKKGTISYAGGTVEGKHYDGVDPEKLTRQQKKVAAMVESLADAVNLDYVFISAEPGMGGAYVKGGTVYVNINAGMGVDGFSQTMAAASLSHELTHWMQDYAPEQYRELKDFIISEILKADPQELRRLVEQQRRWEQGRSLSYEQALDEVVANACQTMLLNSKAITKLARQNMNLAARIADFIEDWTNKIKEAFAEVDTSRGGIYDSLRAVEGSLEHIQELWDNGIEAAAANYNAEQTVRAASAEASTEANENAAPEGDVKNQFIGESAETADKDALALAQQLDKQGVGNESIRQQTGWFKGMDGKWRYEIPGNRMEYHSAGDARFRQDHPEYSEYMDLVYKMLTGELTEAEEKRVAELDEIWGREIGRLSEIVQRGNATLDMILKYDDLFQAYPDLRKVRVAFDNLADGANGYYEKSTNKIVLDNELKNDEFRVKKTLAHEIQHAIQNIEGFTPGSNPDYWANQVKQGASQTASVEEREERKRVNQEYNKIRNDNPEFFDEASQLYQDTPDEPLRNFDPVTKERIAPSPAWQEWQKKRDSLAGRWGRKAVDDFMLLSKKVIRFETPQTSRSPVDLYYNTAGEIEARDAAFRSTFVNDSQYKGIKPNLGDENTVFAEGAQFQRWDNTDGDTAAEANGREQAYAQIESENAVLKETVAALRKLTDKQSGTIAKLQKRLQITKTPEVREGDAKRMAGQLVREYGSRADRERIGGELKALGDYILQTDAAQLSEDEIKNRARQIAVEILDDAREQYAIEDENLAGIAKSIKGKKLTIDPAFLGELDQVGGFDALRKRNFGLFTLAKADSQSIDRSEYTSVSQFYSDLQSEYGKGYFPDLANEGEELLAIAENARAAAPMEINPFEQYMGEAVEHLSNQIAMDALGGVLRANPATDADRAKTRREALNEQIKQLKREQKIAEKDANELWQTVYDLSLQLDRAESKYKSLGEASKNRIAQVRAEGSARQVEIKSRERERAAKKIQKLKEHYAEMRQNARERRENTGTRRKIRRLIDQLNNRLKHPTETKHVPRELMQITLDVLEMIDLDTGRGSITVADKIAKIRSLYESYKTDPTYQIAYDDVTANMLDQLSQTIQGTKLQDMNESQLRAVYEALKSLTHVIDTAVKVKIGNEERDAFELSREMTRETRGVPKAQRGWLREKLIPAHLRADVAFRRFAGFKKNSAWETMAKLLNDGQLKETRLRMELSRPFEKIFSDQKALADFTGVNTLGKLDKSKLVDIGLKDADGNTILVTHDIMVGLYMDLLNEDNRRHFINGGKTIPNLEDYYDGNSAWGAGAQRSAGIAERLSELNRQYDEAQRTYNGSWADDLKAQIDALKSEGEEYADKVQAAIEAAMTEYDRAWVDACQQLMDVDSKRELNRTTMDVYGIEKASVPNYWPITSDPDFLSKPMETVVQDMSLENVGFMKERIKGANPSLALGTVQTVTRQIDRVSHYCGMMPAVRSFGKVWNKTEAGYADSIKKATREVFQKSGVDYVENLIADLNGGRQANRDSLGLSAVLGKLRGNLAQTTLTLNVRVALAQAASYPTAAAELGWGPLAKALARGGKDGRIISRADTELIARYSPLLYHRMQGYSSPELGDIQSSNRLSSRIWRKARWATGWIQAVDGATVGRLWYAAEYWVQENKPTLQKGTDAYYEAVAEKFNAVVEKTQPNYTTMQRAAILRDPDNLVKTFTMFMTQRLQNYNILYDATASYQKARADLANGQNGVTEDDVKEARQNMARAVTSQLAQAAVYVGFKVLADALLHNMKKYRDKDTGDFTPESVSLAVLDAYLDAWMGINIFGSELYGIVKAATGVSKWYGLSVSGVDSVNDLIENMLGLIQADWSSEEGRKKAYAKLLKAGESLAQAMGIPLTNGIKLGQAVYYRIVDMADGNPLGFDAGYERTKKQTQTKEAVDAGVPKRLYLDTIKEANTNGGTLAQDELGTYLREALPAGKLTEDQADIIWSVQGWSTDRAGWNAKTEKKEAKAQWQDVLDAANAAGDGKGNVTQEELASYLTGEINAGRLTEAEAEEAWKAAGPTWKKSYAEYVRGK